MNPSFAEIGAYIAKFYYPVKSITVSAKYYDALKETLVQPPEPGIHKIVYWYRFGTVEIIKGK